MKGDVIGTCIVFVLLAVVITTLLVWRDRK